MIKPYHLLIALALGAVLAFFLLPRGSNGNIDHKIDSLHAVVRWKEIREGHWRDSIREKDIQIASSHRISEEAANAVSLAEARVSEWQGRYYTLKKIVPQNSRDSLKGLVVRGNACDSLVTELGELSEKRKDEVLAIKGELTATISKMKALDTLNLIMSSENMDLKQLDSLHIKNEKLLKKKAKRAFLKGTALGVVLGAILALVI